ncbi:hypothetical protein BKA61DRAFT_557727 [Leptodontidium sp. MPI-SDFR-AT-0119]|nr:hypothetical protein BKA61DRAFT_557727 [Leptodontidium sp. MPI-SDFR-AT-0119]
MEALAALGLAGNVVQFVDFVSKLISAGVEIAGSVEGATERTLEIEKVYNSLDAFSSRLHVGGTRATNNEDIEGLRGLVDHRSEIGGRLEFQDHIRSLEELAADCNSLCRRLLETVRKLHNKGPAGCQFKSLIAALRTAWSSKKIKDLEERLERYQKMISLHFFPLLSQQQSYMLQTLDKLRDESFKLRVDQATKFEDLAKRLQELGKNLSPDSKKEIIALDDESSEDEELQDNSDVAYMIKWAADAQGRKGKTRKLNSESINNLVEGISSLALTERDLALIAKEQAFLRSLNYPSRSFRHDDISVAHKKTFQWILEPDQEQGVETGSKDPSMLLTWLKHGTGLFWVSGKAGSGKSTLMKFIANHTKTRRSLEEWVSPKRLVIATHYFWTAGTEMQKSQQGLLRSLLYDICRMCPEHIPDICPVRWSRTNLVDSTHASEWSTHELLEALRALARRPVTLANYCMFIDGVDEFNGDHFELCQVLKELSASPNFKCCLSSRPFNVFEDAFGGGQCQKLNIHDLTREDISVYAQSRLMEHPRWTEVSFSKEQMESVINSITERADGVFLWVFLVTRSLRDGLVNGDTIRDLQKRLESLPTRLEAFFKHMLSFVEDHYHQTMARVLRIAINARQSLDLRFYQIHEYEVEDEDYALNQSTESYALERLDATLDQCRRRINARCGGLLEIRNNRVEFLHRTVRDFFLTREMNDYLCQKAGRDFMVNLSTIKVYVFLFRCWFQNDIWLPLAKDEPFWRECLKYANDAIEESEDTALMLLDAVGDLYQNIVGSSDSDFLNVPPDYIFRSEILRAGVDKYVSVKLREFPNFFDSIFESPLCNTIDQPQWSEGHIKIIIRFLELDVDLNAEDSESPWCQFLQQASMKDDDHNFRKALENSLFSIFLKKGARRDLQVHCQAEFEIALDQFDLPAKARSTTVPQTEPRYPCTHLIAALFRHRCSHRYSNECLGALEDFLTGNPEEVKLQLKEILGAIQEELQGLASQTTEPGRLTFFAKIAQKIIAKGNQAGLEMEMLVPDFLATFTGGAGSALVDMIRNKDESTSCYLATTPSKRRRDYSGITPSSKRRKLDRSQSAKT